MTQAGTKGQTNVTQSNSTGNQKIDISPIDGINSDMSLDDIAGLYTNVANQYGGIVSKAAEDVGRRQTELVGNDFGAVNPYNYNEYYSPAATSFMSAMRIEGTQRALEEGMDRAKKEAEQKAQDAQQNYSNAQTTLENLENARRNVTAVTTGEIGGETSASELLKFAEAANAENADELYRDVSAKFLSDELVNGDWNIREYRDQAKADTLSKFGVTPEQYANFSQEEHDAFWARGDVGAYWTNRYAYQYAANKYNESTAQEYQKAYEYNYNVVKQVFDSIKSGSDHLESCVAAIKTIKFETKDVVPSSKVTYSANSDTIQIGETRYTFDNSEAAKKGEKDSQGRQSIYAIVSEAEANNIKEKVDNINYQERHMNYTPGIKQNQEEDLKRDIRSLESYAANAVAKSNLAAQDVAHMRKVSFDTDYDNVERLVETAFGADFQSINYLMDMRANNPQQYEDLVHDYSLVLTYGQVFEIADGQKTYHTAEGDKVLEAGTYVMYTLPGFQDANGNFLEPNLKRMMELRSEEFSADMDEAELEEEIQKCMEGYQKVVTAALFLAAGSDCDVNENIVHAAIYASDPAREDTKTGAIYGGHTTAEIIEKFGELADKDGETAYTLFTKIIKKAASVAGSMMANYGGQLTTMDTKDAKGRDMVGSELVGAKDANTLFEEGDIDNLTVEEATALWGVIGTSIDQYNSGKTDNNIKSDFLTADGLNWFNKTGIEMVRGVVGIVDLVGNLSWTVAQTAGLMFSKGLTGQQVTREDYDNVFRSKRWGTGGITGNWTGATSTYDQFVGEYKETAFGYGEENQWRMTNNLTHLVNPLMADVWFGEDENATQNAMGIGRTGDEGFNYRSVMNGTANLAGLVGGVVIGNYIAKGVATAAGWGSEIAKSAASAAATHIKGNFAKAAIVNASKAASKLMSGTSKVAGVLGGSSDDVASAILGQSDEIVKGTAGVSDDIVGLADDVVGASDDVIKASDDLADDVVGRINSTQDDILIRQQNVANELQVWSESADDSVNALGAAARSITASSASNVTDDIITYNKALARKLLSSEYDKAVVNDVLKAVGNTVTKRAFSLAHLSAFSGQTVDDLTNLSDDAITILSNLAYASGGGYLNTAEVPKDLYNYLTSFSKDKMVSMVDDISERAAIAHKAHRAWTTDDTIRYLAGTGWDSKHLTLLTKDWLKDQLQDLSTDILYGYIKPEVTNEGTDRETIDEYLTNPLNYAMNLAASGIQFFGGRWANKKLEAINSHRLDKAYAALARAEEAGDDVAIQRKSKKVIKLVDRANRLADAALEKGRSLDDVRELTEKANAYADDAMITMNEHIFRNMSDDELKKITGISGLSNELQKEDIGIIRNLFYSYTVGITKAHANYFEFKKMLNTYNNGLGWITDVHTNGSIWNSLFDGKHEMLKKLNIPRESVTIAQQKQIYKAMVDKAMENPIAKTIPGLRNSLNNYFDVLLKQGEDILNSGKSLRAGYMPIESMLNTNKDVSAGIRGFSSGDFVLHSGSANPYLERSANLSDENIVAAILRGDKEIQLKDAKGRLIVDEDGIVQTRALNPDGLNFLDSITNAYNSKTFHDYIDPIVGPNGEMAGSYALKNAHIVINQKGAMKIAVDKSIKNTEKRMNELVKKANKTDADAATTAAVKKKAKAKLKKVETDNPYITRAMAQNEAIAGTAKQKLASLNEKMTTITKRQSEYPAVLLKYVDEDGNVDTRSGLKVFEHYRDVAKEDIKKFQNGDYAVGETMDTPFHRFDHFAWEYGQGKFFGEKVKGYTQQVEVDNTYYAWLQNCIENNVTEPPKDMVMKRMTMTEKTYPKNKAGEIFYSTSAKGNKYEWESPLRFFRSSGITDDSFSNLAVKSYQNREIAGWDLTTSSGKKLTTKDVDSLVLDTPENIALARYLVAHNIGGKVLPVDSEGNLVKTANNMLQSMTRDIVTDRSYAISFAEYVDELSTKLAEKSVFTDAFNKKSAYYGIFDDINSYANHGGSFDDFGGFLVDKLNDARISGKDPTDIIKAWSIWDQIQNSSGRPVGLGENFDPGMENESGFSLLNSSAEAVEQNELGVGKDPAKLALEREELDKSYAARYSKEYEKQLSFLNIVTDTPEQFKEGMKYFKKEFKEYLNSPEFAERKRTKTELMRELGGGTDEKGKKHKGIIDDTRSIIKKASKDVPEIKKRINEYSETRQYRQKTYGHVYSREDSKNDALKAFGATTVNDSYSEVKNPVQYRSARTNIDAYDLNAKRLAPLKEEYDSAVVQYRQLLAQQKFQKGVVDEFEKEGKKLKKGALEKAKDELTDLDDRILIAQGIVDQTRKQFSQEMTDLGIDLTDSYAHAADWSGVGMEYDRMMLMGESLEGTAQQSIDAMNEVRSLVISKSKLKGKKKSDLLAEIDENIKKLTDFKEKVPEFETINFRNARGRNMNDSLEMGLVSAMNKVIYGDGLEQSSRYMIMPNGDRVIVDTKPTNGIFTDEQLNSIGVYSGVRGSSKKRLDIETKTDFTTGKKYVTSVARKYELDDLRKNTFEFDGDPNAHINFENIGVDDDGPIGISLEANDDYVDLASQPAEKIVEINRKNFEPRNSAYRMVILDESSDVTNKPLTKEYSYGDKQPQYDKLAAASEKANAIYEYKQLETKNQSVKSSNQSLLDYGQRTGYAVAEERTFDKDLAKFLKEHNLTEKDTKISIEDAQTNAWMADAELKKFEEANGQVLTDVKASSEANLKAKLEELKTARKSTVEKVKTAREFGDLSENEEYRSARDELRRIDSEISDVNDQLKQVTGKKKVTGVTPKELSEAERALLVNPEDVETIGESYGPYTFVKMAGENYDPDEIDEMVTDMAAEEKFEPDLDYNADAAYTEWLAFSKDEDALQAKINRQMEQTKKVSKKAKKESEKAANTKVNDPDDASRKTSFKEISEEAMEGDLKKKLSKADYDEYQRLKKHLEYAKSTKGDKKAEFFRDADGILYLANNSPNLAGYSTYMNHLNARGYAPPKKNQDVPPVDAKADKKARKEMNKAITKNRHAGDIVTSKLEEWEMPRDKNGNIVLDAASRNSTIANMEEIYRQVKKATGMEIGREGMLVQNEYADLLTRITDESTNAGVFRKTLEASSNFAQAIQNMQLAGGASFVNALSIAQLRGAIFQDPFAMKQYIQAIGSMRNSRAVAMMAQKNIPLLSKFVLETKDASILNEFGAAIATRPGVSDGGVLQNMMTNTFNLKKDFVEARVKNNGSIPKALKDIVAKDVVGTVFEDATFKNAIPVLRAKMLIANYDAAINRLMKKFPDMDGKLMEKAAIKMSYAKTESFFNPYYTIGKKKLTDVLDDTYTRQVRTFAASFTNSKSQTTVLDALTNFFFALRYKMMLSGRVYAGAAGALPSVEGALAGRALRKSGEEITKDSLDSVLNSVGTAFMHSGSMMGLGSLAACAVTAAASAQALGIPTSWDDVSWIDEYDGSFKVPDVLLKFQTIGQIWLPNSYNEEQGLHVDPTKAMYGIDTMSSIFTLQNSLFRTIDRTVNPETYYAAPQRGIIGSASSEDGINKVLNASLPRAIGDELLGSNLLSPYKAVYEIIMDSTYFGNNIWEKRKLPDGKDNPNYDFGRNVAAITMHLLGLDQVLDGGKGYNDWVKGKGKPGYVEQDQIGTVEGSGIFQHEFWSAAVDMMEGKYIEAIYGAGELPIKVQNLSSKARTEFNTRVKNIVASYNDEYKAVTQNVDSTNDAKDAAFKEYAKKSADAVATWSKKYDFVLGKDQKLVPYVTRTLMAMVSGEYDDNMYYVQDAYWKASQAAQIEGVTSANYWLDDVDLKEWIAEGKSAEDFAAEKNKRAKAYNDAQDDEYDARQALIEANYDADGNEKVKGLKDYLTNRYSYNDLKAEQRAVNKEIYTSIHSKLDMPVGEFDNFKEMKTYYEKLIEGATSKNQKVNLAMRYNTYVFDLIAPYAEKYGANIVNDGYYNGTGLANDLAEYVILPADKKYYGKTPIANYIKDVFNVGYRNGDALPTDAEIYDKFITAQNLMMKGAISSSISVLDNILDQIKKGRAHVSDADYNRIINMRAILSARSK